jgi:uncharacterized membrane protein
MLTLVGVLVVIAGFALRFNPLLVVAVAAFASGWAAGFSPDKILTLFGEAYARHRYLSLFALTLPVVGILESHGLKMHAQACIRRIRSATAGRLLLVYLFIREIAAALGLTSLGGHPQMVRPLLAPMAEGAAAAEHGELSETTRERILAMAAATDNVGLFFAEDVFIAFSGVLLMKGFLDANGFVLQPIDIAKWGIPTAIASLVIHGVRLLLLDRWIAHEVAKARDDGSAAPDAGGVTADRVTDGHRS